MLPGLKCFFRRRGREKGESTQSEGKSEGKRERGQKEGEGRKKGSNHVYLDQRRQEGGGCAMAVGEWAQRAEE